MLPKVTPFIEKHWDRKSPLLLALSGGPDSMALLQLLLAAKRALEFPLEVAHVDHRWRRSSHEEAAILKSLCSELALPFHLKVLDPTKLQGNLEEACREERLLFFKKLCSHFHYQAVLLAHHADDQAETVLKRILEGSSLSGLGALSPVTIMKGMVLWRPLLQSSKRQIEGTLEDCPFVPFIDETNVDERYTRARLRHLILPFLSEKFGKNVASNLCHFGEEAKELKAYFDAKTEPILASIQPGPFGFMVDLKAQGQAYIEKVQSLVFLPEARHLVHNFCKKGGIEISRASVETAARHLTAGAANKRIDHSLMIDRFCLFALNKNPPRYSDLTSISVGEGNFGNWKVIVKEISKPSSFQMSDWHDCWRGNMHVILPKGEYFMANVSAQNTKALSKRWNNAKVPAFMRPFAPLIVDREGHVVYEFLTGRVLGNTTEAKSYLEISLE